MKSQIKNPVPLLALRELVVFPQQVVPLFVGREKSIKALDDAMSRNREIFLAAQRKSKTNDPTPDEIYEFGTIAHQVQMKFLANLAKFYSENFRTLGDGILIGLFFATFFYSFAREQVRRFRWCI